MRSPKLPVNKPKIEPNLIDWVRLCHSITSETPGTKEYMERYKKEMRAFADRFKLSNADTVHGTQKVFAMMMSDWNGLIQKYVWSLDE